MTNLAYITRFTQVNAGAESARMSVSAGLAARLAFAMTLEMMTASSALLCDGAQ